MPLDSRDFENVEADLLDDRATLIPRDYEISVGGQPRYPDFVAVKTDQRIFYLVEVSLSPDPAKLKQKLIEYRNMPLPSLAACAPSSLLEKDGPSGRSSLSGTRIWLASLRSSSTTQNSGHPSITRQAFLTLPSPPHHQSGDYCLSSELGRSWRCCRSHQQFAVNSCRVERGLNLPKVLGVHYDSHVWAIVAQILGRYDPLCCPGHVSPSLPWVDVDHVFHARVCSDTEHIEKADSLRTRTPKHNPAPLCDHRGDFVLPSVQHSTKGCGKVFWYIHPDISRESGRSDFRVNESFGIKILATEAALNPHHGKASI